ncbi:MAG: SRPBCC domain-containing protein [bacterium]|nr:SRPBCC domain-containing protein [bacterium]
MSSERSSAPAVRIERELDAPVEDVWRMWTDPVSFESWYGPPGATIIVAAMELHVGGDRRVRMDMMTPRGPMTMWFTGQHQEIIENSRLVYSESMSDESGNALTAAAAGLPPDHPTETTVTVELTSTATRPRAGTRLTLTHEGIPAGSPGEAGWKAALGKLTACLLAGT